MAAPEEKKEPGLVSMKRPAREASAEAAMPSMDQEYGWGLQLRLENFELDKLKMKLPRVGQKFHIEAEAVVVGVNESQSAGNKGDRGVQIQITALSLEGTKGA